MEAWRPKWIEYTPQVAEVVPEVKRFCSAVMNRENPKHWLSLLGPSGIGKTYILKQAFDFLRVNMRIITKTHADGRHSMRGPNAAHIKPLEDLTDFNAARDYARYDLIYIEDIASGGENKLIRSRVLELLQLRSGRWTMLCANLYREAIEAYFDGRIASRLKRDGGIMVELPNETPDFWDCEKR